MTMLRRLWRGASANDRVMAVGVLAALVLLAVWGLARLGGDDRVETPRAEPFWTDEKRQAAQERAATADDGLTAQERYDNKTAAARPRWCSFYDRWKRASDQIDSIGRRHGSQIADWPPGVFDDFLAANEAQGQAAGMLWDLTEAGTVPRGWDARAQACR